MNKIVYPSGSDRAAYSLPMLVPAPALFSMNTVWPHIAESFSASMRATISVGPPAATATMMRTGFVGYSAFDVCARAASGHAATPPSAAMNSRRRMRIAMRPSRGGHATEQTISHLDVLRCGISIRSLSAWGHVWTAPAVQEESDYQRSVRVRSCIRPLSAAVWPLALM